VIKACRENDGIIKKEGSQVTGTLGMISTQDILKKRRYYRWQKIKNLPLDVKKPVV